ncbi:MAG: UDP-N-acetylmuramate dehydrogenase [Candidatus Glassbacteria bacterium]|nr:UDP-N-acetylmuramate dehydrogenase [Candidatus Glassbacteria bacterium]
MSDSPVAGLRKAVEGISGLKLELNYPLSRLTSVGTGGTAKAYVAVEKVSALKQLMSVIEQPYCVMGSGTNLLLSDRPFDGTIVRLGSAFRRIRRAGDRLTAGAGATLERLVDLAIGEGFPGFEELAGVPGSVGGAAAMNAGTHLVEIGELVEKLVMVDAAGRRRIFRNDQLVHSYRRSLAPVPGVITALSFSQAVGGNPEIQRARANELTEGRRIKHPWRAKTFGSTFKNPPGQIAARLIDSAGLKGTVAGGARVSPVHANFIENHDNAASSDILALIKLVRSRVKQATGVTLEPEVRLVGFSAQELGELAPYAVSLTA